jgi:hypothetical protein
MHDPAVIEMTKAQRDAALKWCDDRAAVFEAASKAASHGQKIADLGYSLDEWLVLMDDAAFIFRLHRDYVMRGPEQEDERIGS